MFEINRFKKETFFAKEIGNRVTENEKTSAKSKGETRVEQINDVINMFSEVEKVDNSNETLKASAPNSPVCTGDMNMKNFIIETLSEAGIPVTDDLVNKILINMINAYLDGDLNIIPNIATVSQLIDAELALDEQNDSSTSPITKLIDRILNGAQPKNNIATIQEVKDFIINNAAEINSQNTDTTYTPATVNIETPEQALNALIEKMSNATLGDNMSVEEFLLQYEDDATLYLQMQYGYPEDFARIIAKYLANCIDDNYNNPNRQYHCEYNKYNGGDIEKVKSKFIDFLQNKFQSTDMTSFVQLDNSGLYAWTTNGEPHPFTNGYISYGLNDNGYVLSGNNDFGYDNFGNPNSAKFFEFMNKYLREEIYGGELGQHQLEQLYKKIIYDFSKGVCIPNQNNKTLLNNKNLADFWASMMKIAEQYPPLPTNNIESLDLDMLFGDTNLTNAAPDGYIRTDVLITNFVNQKKCDYLLCDDPGLRVFISTLFDRAKELKINRDVDYQEFFNTFVEELNKKCGMTTKYWYGHKAELSREALEKYLENNTVDDLVDFINSKELRDIHYMKSFEINGEIEGFGQGISYDCSLLSDLIALSGSEKGRNTLKESIIDNGDGTYSVILKGGYKNGRYVVLDEPAVYKFTLEQLFDARESGKYSVGDWDTLLVELAIAKHREAIGKRPNTSGNGDPYLNFLDMGETIHYFTGNCMAGTSFYASQGKSRAQNFYEYILNAFTSGAIADIDDGNIGDYAILVSIDMDNGTSHAYAVHEVTSEGIWLVNPGSSQKPIYYTWEQFLTELPITGIKLYQL